MHLGNYKSFRSKTLIPFSLPLQKCQLHTNLMAHLTIKVFLKDKFSNFRFKSTDTGYLLLKTELMRSHLKKKVQIEKSNLRK